MAIVSNYARRKKLDYFFKRIGKNQNILEIGCADGWVGEYALKKGWNNFVGMDIAKPTPKEYGYSFIRGDINNWNKLGLKKNTFDVVIAFEVIEHGDFFEAIFDLLKPGGYFMYTTPVPHMDWVCKILEKIKLNQKRTSPHTHLIYTKDIPHFTIVESRVKGFISQWGIMKKPTI